MLMNSFYDMKAIGVLFFPFHLFIARNQMSHITSGKLELDHVEDVVSKDEPVHYDGTIPYGGMTMTADEIKLVSGRCRTTSNSCTESKSQLEDGLLCSANHVSTVPHERYR